MQKLFVGFKGKNNASCILTSYLSEIPYLLTNSYNGVKNDIVQLEDSYDYILMFGIDKKLKDMVRIECVAEREGSKLLSTLDLNSISKCLNEVGISNNISDIPTQYLCNEAYWFALQKFNGKVAFIHIPSIKNIDKDFLLKMKSALC